MVEQPNNQEKIYIRQGDVLFEQVSESEVLTGEVLETKTVALGEITGHHHSFNDKSQVLLYKDPQEKIPTHLSVSDTSSLTELRHQEHLSIQFPPGHYKIHRERSYNPFIDQIQRSRD